MKNIFFIQCIKCWSIMLNISNLYLFIDMAFLPMSRRVKSFQHETHIIYIIYILSCLFSFFIFFFQFQFFVFKVFFLHIKHIINTKINQSYKILGIKNLKTL